MLKKGGKSINYRLTDMEEKIDKICQKLGIEFIKISDKKSQKIKEKLEKEMALYNKGNEYVNNEIKNYDNKKHI